METRVQAGAATNVLTTSKPSLAVAVANQVVVAGASGSGPGQSRPTVTVTLVRPSPPQSGLLRLNPLSGNTILAFSQVQVPSLHENRDSLGPQRQLPAPLWGEAAARLHCIALVSHLVSGNLGWKGGKGRGEDGGDVPTELD